MRGLDPLGDVLRLTYYDQRGEGRSSRDGLAGMTVERYADDAEHLRRSLGLDRPVLIGHSHGAAVALEVALKHRDTPAALVLVSAVGSYEYEMRRPPTVESRLTERARSVLARKPESDEDVLENLRARLPMTVADEASVPAVLAAYEGASCSLAVWEMEQEGFGTAWSVLSKVGELDVPALVIGGLDDWVAPPQLVEQLATSLPRSELALLPACGHFPWIEQPIPFFQIVRRFLRTHLPACDA